jgi:hypothetical protein
VTTEGFFVAGIGTAPDCLPVRSAGASCEILCSATDCCHAGRLRQLCCTSCAGTRTLQHPRFGTGGGRAALDAGADPVGRPDGDHGRCGGRREGAAGMGPDLHDTGRCGRGRRSSTLEVLRCRPECTSSWSPGGSPPLFKRLPGWELYRELPATGTGSAPVWPGAFLP